MPWKWEKSNKQATSKGQPPYKSCQFTTQDDPNERVPLIYIGDKEVQLQLKDPSWHQ